MEQRQREEFSHSEREHDDLPFAVQDVSGDYDRIREGMPAAAPAGPAAEVTKETARMITGGCSSSLPLPDLMASSVLSAPSEVSEESPDASFSSSVFDSQHIDAAASLLTGSLNSSSSGFPRSQNNSMTTSTEKQRRAIFSASAAETEEGSFSQLLSQADDTQPPPLPTSIIQKAPPSSTSKSASTPRHQARHPLPVLPEEQSVTSTTSNNSCILEAVDGEEGDTNNDWILPATTPTFSSFSQQRRMAALAGATAVTSGENQFKVTIDISSNRTTVHDVLDIIGNPDLLRLWCDNVTDLIVVSSSEGARNATVRTTTDPTRAYEGEWIQATCRHALIAPLQQQSSTSSSIRGVLSSCAISASQTVSTLLGFPTYGKITMFVERLCGVVTLTMGPFPGNMEVSHKLRVSAETSGSTMIRIEDAVRIKKMGVEGVEEETARYCGLLDVIEKCFLPGVSDYMDQVLSSLARLRFLVENGEKRIAPEENNRIAIANGIDNESNSPLLLHHATS